MAEDLLASQPCQTCGTTSEKTFTCVQCNNLAFCDPCWAKWVLHTPGAVGWNGKPHEKADPLIVERLRQILEPARTEAEHESELLEDQDTTWFGFGRDALGQSLFHDYGRFAAIMGEALADDTTERYPQLVSFIGETGVGKSTLIKLLIDRQDLTSPQGSKYYAPVTSSNNDRIATTGDVHLYADPSSLRSSTPLLLVDCEGLSGGEAMPKQLRRPEDLTSSGSRERHVKRRSSTRKIAWAETPQTKKREFTVAQLYPRILYTFSDVVVFVLRNPRSFESTVLDKLLQWGAASIDKSINQPVLPHAVIVLNATDNNINEKEWDVSTATQMLMADIHDAVSREPVLQEYVQTWRKRGKIITNTKELLECYYGSINVIRVPYKGSYMLLNEQAGKLTDLIKERCRASQKRKKQLRMIANTEKLQFYLQAAYDHFTKDLNTPFDFVRETLRHSPVSRNFQGNILSLALSIKDRTTNTCLRGDAEQIFRAIGPVIASCVMFDAARQKLPGSTSRLLDERYAKHCVGALRTFADIYWPCSFTNPSFDGELGQCCNVRAGHNPKGHQNKQGKIIGNGDYESDLDVVEFASSWETLIKASLTQLQASSFKLGQEFPDRNELQVAALLHQERLNELYSNILGDATSFVSYSACLCCLRELPECALPCGHVLCFLCIKIYGRRASKTSIEISRCPLHPRDIISSPAWVVTMKPRYAGTRTLCLDGGGMRGMIQLQALREIENVLGPDLRIQHFFDLIVGTGTGGIIAIGLGIKKWTVDATMEKFKDLCKDAFIPREMTSLPLFGALSSIYHGSLYKNRPFAKSLRRYFSDQPLFGGSTQRCQLGPSMKVAIHSTTAIDRQPVVFANYNRPDPPGKKIPYRFIRSDQPSNELRVWEAAHATSATSPYFKPFVKAETNEEYANVDVRYVCPIEIAHQETTLLWNDIATSVPDLMLSVGTGRNVGDRNTGETIRSGTSMSNETTSTGGTPSTVIRQGRGGAGNYKRNATFSSTISEEMERRNAASGYLVRNPRAPMLLSFNNPVAGQSDRANDNRQCDRIWSRFTSGKAIGDDATRQRYMRICPEFIKRLPKFDDVHRVEDIEREAEEALRQNAQDIVEVAHRLIASTFFFQKDLGSVKQKGYGFTCTGSVFCRFQPLSHELKALGWFLISHLAGDFEPYFLIEAHEGGSTSPPSHRVVLNSTVLQDMHLEGNFELEPVRINTMRENAEIHISLCLQATPYSSGVAVLPISGFPRRLMSEDGGVVHLPAAAAKGHSSVIEKPPTTASTDGGSSAATCVASPEPLVSPAFSHHGFDKLSMGSDSGFRAELDDTSITAELPES